jgi:serine/threonine-protein kinase
VALDAEGNLYITDSGHFQVRKVSPAGIITSVVKTAEPFLTGVTVGPAGEIYASGYGGLFRVWQDGTFRLVVRTGSYSGDGGPAIEAGLDGLFGAAVDDAGNVYVAGLHVRKITPSGIISTIAGTGRYEYSGDGGPALRASFAGSGAIAVAGGGVIYVADIFNHVVRELRPTTVAGQ